MMKKYVFTKNVCVFTTTLIAMLFANIASAQEESKEEKPPYKGLILQVNDQWSLKFSGQLNAFFTNNSVSEDTKNDQKSYSTQNIANGLLPSSLIVNPTYKINETTNVTGTFGLWFGTSSNGLNNDRHNTALQQSTVDIRQLSFDITGKFGSFKLGRDFGLFGLDAILSDISLLGVGANYSLVNPAHTSLGGIGYGYLYADRLNQINYTTPTFGGIKLTVGIYDAINDASFGVDSAGNPIAGATPDNTNNLGFHAKLSGTKKFNDVVNGYLGATFVTQNRAALTNGDSATGFDVIGKLNISKFALTGYFYSGSGLGDVGYLIGGTKVDGDKVGAQATSGYYIQGAYTIGEKTPVIPGVYYGASNIDGADDSSTRITASLATVINSNLILRGEFTSQSRQLLLGAAAPKANIIAIGGTFAF